MALANSIAKQAPDSERAYVALKSAWVLRSWRKSLGKEEAVKQEKLAKQEDDLLKNAKEGFQQANMKEDYPICGMDEATVDYLVAALSAHCGEYEAKSEASVRCHCQPGSRSQGKGAGQRFKG